MIYLDSCALVKLIRDEDESGALQAWLDDRPDELMVTSELSHAELLRVVRRNNHTDQGVLIDAAELDGELAEAADVLAALAQVPVDRDVMERAGALEEPMTRTLDAIHLVSLLGLSPAEAQLVTYDRRLTALACRAGVAVVSPS